jgi:hypothetical protein
MKSRITTLTAAAILLGPVAAPAMAQSLEDRIAAVRQNRAAAREAQGDRQAASRTLAALQTPLGEVDLTDLTAREAVKWLADTSGLDIVVHWEALEIEGIDPNQIVQIVGRNLTPARVLTLIARQIVVDQPLLWEATPWYVELMTKTQANQRTVVVVYPIHDLLHEVPNFTDAPEFDLQQITQQSSQGFGGGQGFSGGGGQGLFRDTGRDQRDQEDTTTERAEQIAQLIRDTIEPEIWREHGGIAGSIRYYNGNLIIRAPLYVHRQIGGAGRRVGGADEAVASHGAADRRYVQLNVRSTRADVTELRPIRSRLGAAGRGVSSAPSLPYTRGHRTAGIDGK